MKNLVCVLIELFTGFRNHCLQREVIGLLEKGNFTRLPAHARVNDFAAYFDLDGYIFILRPEPEEKNLHAETHLNESLRMDLGPVGREIPLCSIWHCKLVGYALDILIAAESELDDLRRESGELSLFAIY